MKKIILFSAISFSLIGCAPHAYTLPNDSGYSQQMAEAKKKDAEFAEKVRNINLDTADVGAAPKNYKSLVENAIRNQLKDPDSARFSDMTPPRKEVMVENKEFVYGYATCVNVNAKNSYGGYVGKQLYWVFMRNNEVLRIKNTNDAYGDIIFVGRPVKCN